MATIRVHDYAQIPTESIARAQQVVTNIYGAIGVRTRWLETSRPAEVAHVNRTLVRDAKALLVIVLNPSMSRRQMPPEDTVGAAVVTRCGRGLAYVSFDRVRRVASVSERNAMDVMGMVMAHELGHLLLPRDSHSHSGLMRENWDVEDLQAIERADLEFTSAQAELIREALRRLSGPRSTD